MQPTSAFALRATPPAVLEPGPDEWALFLDFDGTLVDLAATPEAIQVPAELPRLLEELGKSFDGAVAILTGRALSDLDGYLPGLALAAAGQHGAERRLPSGRRLPAADLPELERARREIGDFRAAHPALRVEDKGASIALHYRAAPALQAAILALADRLLAAGGDRLERIEGKFVCELRPAGSDKGSALAAFLLESPFAGRRPLALGDDVTDEAAFAAALDAGGSAIKVGEGASCAPWGLPDPAAVRAWLAQMLEASRDRQ